MAPKTKTKPHATRKRAPRRAKSSNVPEFASLSCVRTATVAAPDQGATVTDQMYNYNAFLLADFPRAELVAQAYQFYRMKQIKVTYKPAYDAYVQNTPGATANTQKPNLYYMIDKADAIPTSITLEGLKGMGARPHSFDEKPISVSWKPSVLLSADAGGNALAAQYKISPWLSTMDVVGSAVWQASIVEHKGLKWYIEQPGAGVGETTVYVEVEIQFEFKKPLVADMTGMTEAVGLKYAKVDRSPDGVEGGSDGITIPKNE